MPRELRSTAFPELVREYAKEGKTVVGFIVHDADDPGNSDGLPRLDVKWVWTAQANGVAPESRFD